MTLCFVSIGSNVEREQNIRAALATLRERFGPLLVSSVYETSAVDFEGEPFYNLVAAFVSQTSPNAIIAILRDIETRQGRVRTDERFGPRTLDLDLLLYGAEAIHSAALTVPHPRLHERAFVLYPLSELEPDLVIPGHGPLRELLAGCAGQRVQKMDV